MKRMTETDITKNYMVQKDRAFRMFDEKYVKPFKELEGTYWKLKANSHNTNQWMMESGAIAIGEVTAIDDIDEAFMFVKNKFLTHKFKEEAGYDTQFFFDRLKNEDRLNGARMRFKGCTCHSVCINNYVFCAEEEDIEKTFTFSDHGTCLMIPFFETHEQISAEEFETIYNGFKKQLK